MRQQRPPHQLTPLPAEVSYGAMVRKRIFAVAGLALAIAGGGAWAAPKAGLIGRSWELEVEFADPQRITIPLPDGGEETYWYVIYRVINRTGRDVAFFPSFRIVTNTLQVVDGGDGVRPAVYDRIAALHRQQFPFFAPPAKITGTLLQGQENARESAAVFKTFNLEASSLTLYMTGFAGRIDRQTNPAFDTNKPESDDNPRSFLFRRTLAVTYDLPGDPQTRASATPIRRNREWVMR
ncbi:MAG: hypothetical protein Q7R41_16820 [Phycisphaerales bacterium]|nr:hypothetical protein [Phycisphaerales bacterium]